MNIEEIKARGEAAAVHEYNGITDLIYGRDVKALIAEVERLTAIIDAYATSARVISLYLEDFCNPNLAYSEMIADASRKASKQITMLKKALELACESIKCESTRSLNSAEFLTDYFIHQSQQLTHETHGDALESEADHAE
jgi:hypothetical protein